MQLGCVSSVSNGQNCCIQAGWRQKPSFAQQYVVLEDLGVQKSSSNKLQMMTKEKFLGDEKSSDNGSKESQRILK